MEQKKLPYILSFIASAVLGFGSVLIILLKVGYPYHGQIALVVYLCGWGALVYALLLFKKRLAGAVRGRWKFVGIAAALLAAGYVLAVIFPVGDLAFVIQDSAAVGRTVATDRAAARETIAGLDNAVADLKAQAALLARDPGTYSAAEKERVLTLWGACCDHLMALEILKQRHRHFYQINYVKHPQLNAGSFLIAYSSLVASCRAAIAVRALVQSNRLLPTMLNEGRADFGIPPQAYSDLVQGLTAPNSLVMLNAGLGTLVFLRRTGAIAGDEDKALAALIDERAGAVYAGLGAEPEIFAENPLDRYEQLTASLWYPFQTEVITLMGDVRMRERDWLVQPADLAVLRAKMEPGDLMFERKNWYISNVAMPGFWSHIALYTGTPAEMDAYFAGNDTDLTNGRTVTVYLAEKYPGVFAAYQEKVEGHAPDLIEAVSEGVIIHPFMVSGHADYTAVLRPRLTRRAKLQAILEAYRYFGRPYDFNVDFLTDNAVVCSELTYKAYFPRPGKDGLRGELEMIRGRQVVTPVGVIRKFAQEYGTPRQELDFIGFYEGSERDGRAYARGGEELRATLTRPKWDIQQQ